MGSGETVGLVVGSGEGDVVGLGLGEPRRRGVGLTLGVGVCCPSIRLLAASPWPPGEPNILTKSARMSPVVSVSAAISLLVCDFIFTSPKSL